MKTSQRGLDLIAEFEGVRLCSYNDPAGHCTIGIGHLVHYGPCTAAELEHCISEEEAYDLLAEDVGRFEDCVNESVGVPLNQNQFDALVSFSYNVGCAALQSSTLLQELNAGNYDAVPAQLMRWTHAGGLELPGLVRRRDAEAQLFTTPGEEDESMTPEERAEFDELKAAVHGLRRDVERFKRIDNKRNRNIWAFVGDLHTALQQGIRLAVARIQQEHPDEIERQERALADTERRLKDSERKARGDDEQEEQSEAARTRTRRAGPD